MNWEFEHWNEGKVYLHDERWEEFRKNIDKYGYKGSLHDWNHSRAFMRIHTPRDNIQDIPVPGEENLKYAINRKIIGWFPIYEPFPAFVRTSHDPEGWLPSWNLYLEDNHKNKEEVTILKTGHIFGGFLITRNITANIFAFYKNQFWIVDSWEDYGMGANPPPPTPPLIKRNYRYIHED